jgi:hypothetical protein
MREKTLGEVGTALASEGLGVTGGFLGAGVLGRQIQNRIKSDADVAANPTISNKIMAWSANNVPKIALWYLLKKYAPVEPGEVLTPVKEATVDAKKAVAGSIIFDTIVRLSNGGQNTGTVSIFGYQLLSGSPETQKSASSQADTQRLIQENSALRSELNKALQRLAQPPLPAPVAQAPQVATPVQAPPQQIYQQAPPVIRYQPVTPPTVSYIPAPPAQAPAPVQRASEEVAVQTPPVVSERQKKYGFMNFEQTPPAVQERQAKYGFMKGGEKDIASMFGML